MLIRLPFPISARTKQSNVVTITLLILQTLHSYQVNTIFIEGLNRFSTDPNGQQTLHVSFVNKQLTLHKLLVMNHSAHLPHSLAFPASHAVTQLNFTLNDDGQMKYLVRAYFPIQTLITQMITFLPPPIMCATFYAFVIVQIQSKVSRFKHNFG